MVATASTEHSYWLALAFVVSKAPAFLAVFVYATQAIAFEWKPGFRHFNLSAHPNSLANYTVCKPFT